MSIKNYKLYICGGFVRDKLLGVNSKDVDYAFEFTKEIVEENKHATPEFMYNNMNRELKNEGFEVFLEVPECFTTRAKFPKGHINENLVADFVMCRKESYPDPTSRTPVVEMGTLYDDLARRDANFNAIAIDETGVLIDPFDGAKDIKNKIIRCPINAQESLNMDPLRAIRFLRFAVTKDFTFSKDVKDALQDEAMWNKFFTVVSHERIREELVKMYKFNTHNSNIILYYTIPGWVSEKIFTEILWLKPTMEK